MDSPCCSNTDIKPDLDSKSSSREVSPILNQTTSTTLPTIDAQGDLHTLREELDTSLQLLREELVTATESEGDNMLVNAGSMLEVFFFKIQGLKICLYFD